MTLDLRAGTTILAVLVLLGANAAQGPDGEQEPEPVAETAEPLHFDRGEELGFEVPAGEVLDYAITVKVSGLGESNPGTFQLSAGVDLPSASNASAAGRVGWFRARARAGVLNVRMDQLLEVRILPREWPHVIFRDTLSGTRNRRRELMYGRRDGEPTAWARKDRHCAGCDAAEHQIEGGWPGAGRRHCTSCRRQEHRAWRPAETRVVPANAVDCLSALYVARSMVREGLHEVHFALLDRDRDWDVLLTLGEQSRISTPAGTFRCRAVKLSPMPPAGEHSEERLQGLFGLQGSLSLWMEERSGVLVRIEGVLPLGPLEVDATFDLTAYSGTPTGFAPEE
ncbi:MAG: DUF3108 domain-containing protein [Planctomycetota bacterium]